MPNLILIRHAESENNRLQAELVKQFKDDSARINEEYDKLATRDPGLSETGTRPSVSPSTSGPCSRRSASTY